MTNFSFTDRDSYMAFHKDWKIRYNELTLEIRETRAAIKAAYHAASMSEPLSFRARRL